MKRFNLRSISLVILAMLLLFFLSFSTSDRCIRKTDMPTARMGQSLSVVDGQIYVIGGYPVANAPGMQIVEVYDPGTDSWSTKAPMPTGRRQHATSVVDGKIYAIGGYVNVRQPGLSVVEKYNPDTDTWTRRAYMLTPRFSPATGALNGKIYAIGGSIGYEVQSMVEIYDPASDKWSYGTSLPAPRAAASCVVGGSIYFIGGSLTIKPPHPAVAWVEEYTPAQ